MYTTDYNRLEKKARENNLLDRLNDMWQDALEQTMTEYGVNFHLNSEWEIISTEDAPCNADLANRRHAQNLENRINEAVIENLKKKVYGAIATYNADPFICDNDTIIEMVAYTIRDYGLRHVEDSMQAFDDALKRLDLDDENKYEVSAVYETLDKRLTICFNEDYNFIENIDVEDVELMKGNHNTGDTLSWTYNGKDYSCTGEFYVDKDNNLHHTFIAPNGKEIEITIPYE